MLVSLFADKRFANTLPAEPAPTMMKSYVLSFVCFSLHASDQWSITSYGCSHEDSGYKGVRERCPSVNNSEIIPDQKIMNFPIVTVDKFVLSRKGD